MIVATDPRHLLSPLYRELVRWDNSFSQAWGTTPSRSYVESFDGVRRRLQQASSELRQSPYDELRPLAPTLERRAGDLTRIRTQLSSMSARGTTFGSGWDRVLDQSIADVRYALQLLGSDPEEMPQPDPNPYPGPAPVPSPPYPGEPAPWPQPNPYPGDEYGA